MISGFSSAMILFTLTILLLFVTLLQLTLPSPNEVKCEYAVWSMACPRSWSSVDLQLMVAILEVLQNSD